jgi:hypothetical protein
MIIQVEEEKTIIDGREVNAKVTRYIGRSTYEDHGKVIEADECIVTDYGPRLGTAKAYVRYAREDDGGYEALMDAVQRILRKRR